MAVQVLLALSGEHHVLPAMEARRLLTTADPTCDLEGMGARLVLAGLALPRSEVEVLCNRLAMTKEASLVLGIVEDRSNSIPDAVYREIVNGTFILRSRGFGKSSQRVEREIGGAIMGGARRRGVGVRVSPNQSSSTILVTRSELGMIYSVLIPRSPRSSYRRRAESRFYKSPISIDPLLARVMVNLAGVLKDERVLDPFCGTGTILIEVDLVGARALGIDFSGDIVAGAARNLRALGCTADLVRADALLAPRFLRERFDHIVTDPPYGRASPSSREHRFLLHRLPAVCSALLKKGGTACFASPSTIDLHDEASRASLEVLEFAYQRVHGSLGRHLYLTKKL